jgi:hypothetical protein
LSLRAICQGHQAENDRVLMKEKARFVNGGEKQWRDFLH